MKNISEYIIREGKNEWGFDLIETQDRATIGKSVEFAIIYPAGGIEFFTKNGLKDLIDEIGEENSENEDSLITYSELIDLEADGKWYALSGDGTENGDIDSCYGIHYKKRGK